MIKFKNMIRKRKNKERYDIVDEFEKEPINSVINFSNIEHIFDPESIQLIIDHTGEKTKAYRLRIKKTVSTLIKRPTLNQKNKEYVVDLPELEELGEWTGLYTELINGDSAFNSIYNVFKIINKYNSSKIFIFLPEYVLTDLNLKTSKYCSELEKHSSQTVLRPYFKFIRLHDERELSFTNMTLRCISWINYGITPCILINYNNNYIHLSINIDNWRHPFTFKINININTLINYFKEHTGEYSKTQRWQTEYFYELNKVGDMIPKSLSERTNIPVITVNNNFFDLKNLLNFKGVKNINELLTELYDILNNCTNVTDYCYALISYTLFNNLKKKLGDIVQIIIPENLHGDTYNNTPPAILGYFIDYMNFDFKKQLC